MPAFWLLGTLVLTFLVLLDGARKNQLTVRIIEETVVVPHTRIIIGGKLERN
jgi:hypothetical protein